MKKIIQLDEFEYSEIIKKANLNEEKIYELAEKFYQERGVFRVDIKMGIQKKHDGEYFYFTDVFTTENGLYKNKEFKSIITEKGRRRIENIISKACYDTFFEKFGDAVKFKNLYTDALRKLAIKSLIAYTIAFSGWGVATVLLIYKCLL